MSHRIPGPGDTAVLLPDAGYIHALKSLSRQCDMLDFLYRLIKEVDEAGISHSIITGFIKKKLHAEAFLNMSLQMLEDKHCMFM